MVSQKKSEFNQGVSAKVFAHPHKRADGTNTLYLRVTIDLKKREFNLKAYWPADYFNEVMQEALPRHPKNKDVDAVNMVIDEAKGALTA